MTGSVRVRKSGPVLPEVRVREEVLVMREFDNSSEKLAYMSRVEEDALGNEDCLVRGSGIGGPREGVEE
jgi:hypothetical protein